MPLVPIRHRWQSRLLPRINAPCERSPEALAAVLDSLHVETDPRYAPDVQDGKRRTWCNIFVWDATRALGCEVPHWVGPEHSRRELDANGMIDWLTGSEGAAAGWRQVQPAEVHLLAGAGHPVVACWRNPRGSGHVAMVRPSTGAGIRIAQAGAQCFGDGTLDQGFGGRDVVFFAHE